MDTAATPVRCPSRSLIAPSAPRRGAARPCCCTGARGRPRRLAGSGAAPLAPSPSHGLGTTRSGRPSRSPSATRWVAEFRAAALFQSLTDAARRNKHGLPPIGKRHLPCPNKPALLSTRPSTAQVNGPTLFLQPRSLPIGVTSRFVLRVCYSAAPETAVLCGTAETAFQTVLTPLVRAALCFHCANISSLLFS